jgi:hypothetical protein
LKVEHNESIDNYLPQFLHIGKRVGTLINEKLLALQFGFEKPVLPNLITHSHQVLKAHALIHRSNRNT